MKWMARPSNLSPCRLVMGAQFVRVAAYIPAGMRKAVTDRFETASNCFDLVELTGF